MIPYQRFVVVLGQRFYDETAGNFTGNNYNAIKHYTYGSYRNAAQITYTPNNWVNAAMAGIGDGHNGGGPIWAIFDADAVQRSHWGSAVHVMLALRRCSRQIVVTDEELNGTDMVGELLGKGQRVADQP